MNEIAGTQLSTNTPESPIKKDKIEMPGSKIEGSQYRELVIELIGKGSSDNDIVRILRKKDFRTVRQTISSFRQNYVLSNQQLKEKVGTELMKIEEKRGEVRDAIPDNILRRIDIKRKWIDKMTARVKSLEEDQDDRMRLCKGRGIGIENAIAKYCKQISDEERYIDEFLTSFAAEQMLDEWFRAFLTVTIGIIWPVLPADVVDRIGVEYKDKIMQKYKEIAENLHRK